MTVKSIPDGYHAVTPYMVVKDIAQQIEFIEKAFDGVVIERIDTPEGTMHAEVKIRDSIVMMGQARGEQAPMPMMFYLYVEDADKAFEQARNAGGSILQEPKDQFYGDRTGAVKDDNDNQWYLATRKENVSSEELAKRACEMHKEKTCT
ncbi:MAG: VOC family protein [Cyanobacteria bacterium]|nr:VOC family protein [Cyanobacteriota bacterium]